jgi:ribosomal 50S subunit-recycling heat shock protein
MGVRIDTLLHWLCLTRSRSLAGRACREGHVLVNGAVARASREVRPGDRIGLRDPLRATLRELELLDLPERQASRKDATTHYRWLTAAPVAEPWDATSDEGL